MSLSQCLRPTKFCLEGVDGLGSNDLSVIMITSQQLRIVVRGVGGVLDCYDIVICGLIGEGCLD